VGFYKKYLATQTSTAKTSHLPGTYWESPQIELDDIPLTG